ncbi:uncharacterized protein CLUP02_03865 [Colletotrichum lupini]|uniref:Uncharacterized protein n=1 Tax=Colletotrichum lupini TaxID=145971 RepID=A0A9Q8SJN1_9PEZI|nr:uncharacterized protein CLUP02_03865 [Colletotrichum lupini]UQC78388.1 hypothetical protein CLUP02_03865 [Colletotrichum lupini]
MSSVQLLRHTYMLGTPRIRTPWYFSTLNISMTSLSIPSQLSQLPNHREREDKVNVQTPGPVAGFSVAASFKLEAELTPPSPPPLHTTHYALHFLTTSPITLYSLFLTFLSNQLLDTPLKFLLSPYQGTPYPTGICCGPRRGILHRNTAALKILNVVAKANPPLELHRSNQPVQTVVPRSRVPPALRGQLPVP